MANLFQLCVSQERYERVLQRRRLCVVSIVTPWMLPSPWYPRRGSWTGTRACMPMLANDCVIAHLCVGRLTMSRDDGSITFRGAAVGAGGELCTSSDACWLSAGEGSRTGQGASTGDSACDRSWAK